MINDHQYLKITNKPFLEHHYGENIHILNNVWADSILARFGTSSTVQPDLNNLLQMLYSELLTVGFNLYATRSVQGQESRMIEKSSAGAFKQNLIDPLQKVVLVDMARAGTLPSQCCFERTHYVIDAQNIRQDHFYMNRETNDRNQVIGVNVAGSKVGGDIDQALVLFPDPMGATGGSINYVVNYYRDKVEGQAKEMIALHLVITPEYIKTIKENCPHLKVIALRLDRGLSTAKILESVPGSYPDQEFGLTDEQYIVPGLGGVGEILNNSYC